MQRKPGKGFRGLILYQLHKNTVEQNQLGHSSKNNEDLLEQIPAKPISLNNYHGSTYHRLQPRVILFWNDFKILY